MSEIPKSEQIVKISEEKILKWHEPGRGISSFEGANKKPADGRRDDILSMTGALSEINTELWHEEDKARDAMAGDPIIAGVKRKIDKLNTVRVQKVEEIDSFIYNRISFNDDAPLNTETPGHVIDRLTILCLRKYHMRLETERRNVPETHRIKCAEYLSDIELQMKDLTAAYDGFIQEALEGRRKYRMYRQLKMYNDPDLNPVLYGQKKQ